MKKHSRNSGKKVVEIERRKRGFSITLTHQERENLREQAKILGVAMATYVRFAIAQNVPVVVNVPPTNQKLVANLSHAMINLNTLARALNSPKMKPTYNAIYTAILSLQFSLIGKDFLQIESEVLDV
jgi:hypothetical protein